MRKKIPDCAPRTVRLHIPTYNAILDFFANSPSGITGADAIRELILRFGMYCREQRRKGRVASTQDLSQIDTIVLGFLHDDEKPEEPQPEPDLTPSNVASAKW